MASKDQTMPDPKIEQPGAQYLICKGGAYYRPNAQGYTRSKDEAGRYTLEEAISHSHPNGLDGPRDGITYELATRAQHPGWTERGKQWLADGAPVGEAFEQQQQQQESGEGVDADQIDRDGAAVVLAWALAPTPADIEQYRQLCRDGEYDDHFILREFRKHRLAHPPAQPVEPAAGEVRDAIRRLEREVLKRPSRPEYSPYHGSPHSLTTDLSLLKRLTHSPAPSATIERLEGEVAPYPVPDGQTPLNDKLGHHYLDVIKEGSDARDSGAYSPYHGHSLEHCLHATGWVQRDLRLALDAARATLSTKDADHG